jgi:hypothetical protein
MAAAGFNNSRTNRGPQTAISSMTHDSDLLASPGEKIHRRLSIVDTAVINQHDFIKMGDYDSIQQVFLKEWHQRCFVVGGHN